jgi:hypothetical protein
MEASRLPALGLPSHSFTLVIDGEPIPTASTRVFDVLQRDAVWQLAYEGSVNDPSIRPTPPGWLQIRESKAFIMEGFPEALGDISQGISLVKCNFPTGQAQPIDPIVAQEGHTWSPTRWGNYWMVKGYKNLDTEAPLPARLEIRFEDILSEEDTFVDLGDVYGT